MEGFSSVLLGAFILDAVIESVKMVKQKRLQWEHIAALLFGYLIASVNSINIFLEIGLEGEGNLFWNVSYLVFAVIGMRGSGAIHDLYSRVRG